MESFHRSESQKFEEISENALSFLPLSQASVVNRTRRGNNLNLGVFCLVVDTREGATVAKIRVVLADDHPEMIAKIRRTLDEEFEVIDSVEDGNQAVDAVTMMDADILVTDISMPVLDGLQAANRLRAVNSRVKIIFLTIHEDRDYVAAALSTGASGYVTKARINTDLVHAIHEALQGNIFVSQLKPN